MLSKLWNFITGNAASVVEQVESAVDEYFYTDEEKSKDKANIEGKREKFKLKMLEINRQVLQNEQNFKFEVEKIISEREQQIHDTYRAEINASKDVIVAELRQSDLYTKRARPTVIYAGLVFILLELFGIRVAVLQYFQATPAIITSSTDILNSFFYAWGAVTGAYALGRSAEKRGISNTVTQLATGNKSTHTDPVLKNDTISKSIEAKVKEKIRW